MAKKIIVNGTIITINQNNDCIKNGAVAFEDGKITYIGETPKDLSQYNEVINADGNYVMPGLINTHCHTPMSLLRGYADDLPLKNWLEDKIWPLENQYTPEHAKWGAYLSIIEMLRTGTTTFVDMYDNMDEIAQAVEVSGVRAKLCRGVIGLGSLEEQKQKLDEAVRFAKDWNNRADGRITTMMAPHSPYTCPTKYIQQIVEESIQLNLPIHIHMSETEYEVELNVKEYGERPVKYLENIGVFERPTLVAHAVHINDEEIEILAKNDVKVSHNIISNLKLGSGIAPLSKLMEKGVTVSLGTDSSASNNSLDLFEEIRLAALLHKGIQFDATLINAEKALRMATIHGAESIWIEDKAGSLEIGKEADIIVIDTDQPFFYPRHSPISHLAYSSSGRDVLHVFVQGKQVVKNRECLTIDKEKVFFEANRMFQLFSV